MNEKNHLVEKSELILVEDDVKWVRPYAFYIVLFIIISMLLLCAWSSYQLLPIQKKINGSWENKNLKMNLVSTGNNWELILKDYKNVTGFNLQYSGTWKREKTNLYLGNNIELTAKIRKKYFSKEDVEKILKKNDTYNILRDNETSITLKYTQKGLLEMYELKNLDEYFRFTIENEHFFQTKRTLYLNSSFFSNERIPFERVIFSG